MAMCPFGTTFGENGVAKFAPCLVTCELRVHGHCAFAVIGHKAWKDAGFSASQNQKAKADQKDKAQD